MNAIALNETLIGRYRNGSPKEQKEAAEGFLENNKGLVAFVLNRKFPSYRAEHYSDLMQVGMIAMLEQLPNYDPALGKPTTFFHSYILHAMNEYVASMVFGTTTHYLTQITKITRAEEQLKKTGNLSPSLIDLYQATGIPVETIRAALQIKSTTSDSLYMDDESTLNAPDEFNDSPEDFCEKRIAKVELHDAVTKLPPLESNVISMKFGLNGSLPMSGLNIGKRLGISTDEVRKRCAAGIRHLYTQLSNLPFYTDNLRDAQYDAGEQLVSLIPVSAVQREINLLDQIIDEDF